MDRTLRLRRETLTELSVDELTRVNGAGVPASGPTCPLKLCLFPDLTDTSCQCCTASGSC